MLDTEACMTMSFGFISNRDGKKHVLKLLRSVCGLKQSNHSFYQKMSKALEDRNARPCSIDNCVCTSKNLIVIVCVDDCLMLSKK